MAGSSPSAKADALGRLIGRAPVEISASVRALSEAFRAATSNKLATGSTLKTADAFRVLGPQQVVAGPDGERVNRFLADRCGIRAPAVRA